MKAVVDEATNNACKVLTSVAGIDTITGSMSPALVAYSAGMLVVFTPANTNTGAATIAINGLAALDIFRFGGDGLQPGDLTAGVPALLLLDSGADDFYLLNPQDTGYRNIPQNTSTGNTILNQLIYSGQHLLANGGSPQTFTIAANSTTAFPIGTVITLINGQTNNLTIAITTDTMTLAGTTSTGSRTLAQNGIATLIKIGTTSWLISGTGLS